MDVLSDFDFYLKFAKPLVLNLPKSNDKILAAAWVKRLMDEQSAKDELKTSYLKLLLFVLQRKTLIGPFKTHPNNVEALEEFPEGVDLVQTAKELLEKERDEVKKAQDKVLKEGDPSGNYPAYVSDFSADFLEYVAVQEIEDFGVHGYYALAKEPLSSWHRVDKNVMPKAAISTLDVTVIPKSLNATASSPQISKTTEQPDAEPKSAKKKNDEIVITSPSPSPKKKKQSPKRSVLGASPPVTPMGSVPSPEDRSPPTWGSNLLKVQEHATNFMDSGLGSMLAGTAIVSSSEDEGGDAPSSRERSPSPWTSAGSAPYKTPPVPGVTSPPSPYDLNMDRTPPARSRSPSPAPANASDIDDEQFFSQYRGGDVDDYNFAAESPPSFSMADLEPSPLPTVPVTMAIRPPSKIQKRNVGRKSTKTKTLVAVEADDGATKSRPKQPQEKIGWDAEDLAELGLTEADMVEINLDDLNLELDNISVELDEVEPAYYKEMDDERRQMDAQNDEFGRMLRQLEEENAEDIAMYGGGGSGGGVSPSSVVARQRSPQSPIKLKSKPLPARQAVLVSNEARHILEEAQAQATDEDERPRKSSRLKPPGIPVPSRGTSKSKSNSSTASKQVASQQQQQQQQQRRSCGQFQSRLKPPGVPIPSRVEPILEQAPPSNSRPPSRLRPPSKIKRQGAKKDTPVMVLTADEPPAGRYGEHDVSIEEFERMERETGNRVRTLTAASPSPPKDPQVMRMYNEIAQVADRQYQSLGRDRGNLVASFVGQYDTDELAAMGLTESDLADVDMTEVNEVLDWNVDDFDSPEGYVYDDGGKFAELEEIYDLSKIDEFKNQIEAFEAAANDDDDDVNRAHESISKQLELMRNELAQLKGDHYDGDELEGDGEPSTPPSFDEKKALEALKGIALASRRWAAASPAISAGVPVTSPKPTVPPSRPTNTDMMLESPPTPIKKFYRSASLRSSRRAATSPDTYSDFTLLTTQDPDDSFKEFYRPPSPELDLSFEPPDVDISRRPANECFDDFARLAKVHDEDPHGLPKVDTFGPPLPKPFVVTVPQLNVEDPEDYRLHVLQVPYGEYHVPYRQNVGGGGRTVERRSAGPQLSPVLDIPEHYTYRQAEMMENVLRADGRVERRPVSVVAGGRTVRIPRKSAPPSLSPIADPIVYPTTPLTSRPAETPTSRQRPVQRRRLPPPRRIDFDEPQSPAKSPTPSPQRRPQSPATPRSPTTTTTPTPLPRTTDDGWYPMLPPPPFRMPASASKTTSSFVETTKKRQERKNWMPYRPDASPEFRDPYGDDDYSPSDGILDETDDGLLPRSPDDELPPRMIPQPSSPTGSPREIDRFYRQLDAAPYSDMTRRPMMVQGKLLPVRYKNVYQRLKKVPELGVLDMRSPKTPPIRRAQPPSRSTSPPVQQRRSRVKENLTRRRLDFDQHRTPSPPTTRDFLQRAETEEYDALQESPPEEMDGVFTLPSSDDSSSSPNGLRRQVEEHQYTDEFGRRGPPANMCIAGQRGPLRGKRAPDMEDVEEDDGDVSGGDVVSTESVCYKKDTRTEYRPRSR